MTDQKDLEHIVDEMERAHYGDAWHGSSVGELLDDVSAAQAASRPIANAHSIWEVALHIRSWRREVLRRLSSRQVGTPEDGDWPATPEATAPASEEAWKRDRASLAEATRSLQEAVRKVSPDELDKLYEKKRDPALGTGVTMRVLLHGVAQHDAYHGGQIAILKKAVVGDPSRTGSPA